MRGDRTICARRLPIAAVVATVPSAADVVIIGGGFYGLRIAAMIAAAGRSCVLLERETRFLSRASFNNQARVHGGYHYPRSVLTAMRARTHYERFGREFASALNTTFRHVYAIARHQTKIRASEFVEFCRRIDAPIADAPREFARQFAADHIERAFLVEETVFDAHRLADQAIRAAMDAGVRCLPGVEVLSVEPGGARRLRCRWQAPDGVTGSAEADWIVNATYSSLNAVLERSTLQPIALIHEDTELAIVRPPSALRGYGVTVMDGPFWSCVPFPPHKAYSLSHVRYTPHARWESGKGESRPTAPRVSHAPLMQRDAMRMLPLLKDAQYVTSLWETKTILPRSAGDDSRPILVRHHEDAPGLVSVLGGKIDSVYDVEAELRDVILRV